MRLLGLIGALLATPLVGPEARADNIEPNLESLSTAPLEVVVSGHRVTLESYLWRDFMPTTLPASEPKLIAQVRLIPGPVRSLPGNIRLQRLWLIAPQGVWSSDRFDPLGPDRLVRVARDGPAWPTGTKVDVIVQLQIDGGQTLLLRATGQTIHKVS